MGIFPNYRGKHKKYRKPPPSSLPSNVVVDCLEVQMVAFCSFSWREYEPRLGNFEAFLKMASAMLVLPPPLVGSMDVKETPLPLPVVQDHCRRSHTVAHGFGCSDKMSPQVMKHLVAFLLHFPSIWCLVVWSKPYQATSCCQVYLLRQLYVVHGYWFRCALSSSKVLQSIAAQIWL